MKKNEPFDPFFYSITDFRQAMPLWHHSLSERTLMTPAQTELQSELIPLLLCLFFCFVFVNAENFFHVGFVYQQLSHLTPD